MRSSSSSTVRRAPSPGDSRGGVRDDGDEGCVLRFENVAPKTASELAEWMALLPSFSSSTAGAEKALNSIISEVIDEPDAATSRGAASGVAQRRAPHAGGHEKCGRGLGTARPRIVAELRSTSRPSGELRSLRPRTSRTPRRHRGRRRSPAVCRLRRVARGELGRRERGLEVEPPMGPHRSRISPNTQSLSIPFTRNVAGSTAASDRPPAVTSARSKPRSR